MAMRMALAYVAQPAFHLLDAAQPDNRVRGQLGRPGAAALEVHPEGEREQRLATPERVAQRLAVVVPQRLAALPSPPGPSQQPGQPYTHRQVEPDDRVGRVEHERGELAR